MSRVNSLVARDLRWHTVMRLQSHIGCGMDTYDNDPANTANPPKLTAWRGGFTILIRIGPCGLTSALAA